jgi:hypothetical protein
LKRRNSNGQKTHEKMLTPVRIAIITNTTNKRLWGKRNPNPLLVGMQAGATTLEKI